MAEPEATPLAVVQTLARGGLASYCILMDPTYEPTAHTRLICDHLEALERGDIRALMIFMPPRHGKSYHSSERFPAWYLGRNPDRRVILASYAAGLAETNSRTVRGLLEDERNPFPVRIEKDSRAVGRWETVQGGSLLAAGVGGGITGFGAHLLNIDDPFEGREEADSELQRDKVWAWYQEVARTRLMPGGVELLTNTRWHEDDLSGRILNSPAQSHWTILTLPALAEADDPIGRAPGEPLWPARYVRLDQWEALPNEQKKTVLPLPSVRLKQITERGWTALYQQRPVPDEGGMFKKDWMQRRYTPREIEERKNGPRWRVIQAIDSATREGVGADLSVIATWGYDGISCYLLDVWRERVDYPQLKEAVQEQYWKWKPRVILVEDTTHGRPIIQELRYTSVLPLVPKPAKGTKENRASAVTDLFYTGKVALPESALWLDEWITEHTSFPLGAHDDQVDTTSLALAELTEPSLSLPRYSLGGQRLATRAV